MVKIFSLFVKKYGSQLCTLAMIAAVGASQMCRFVFFQPEEPIGLDEMASKIMNRK